jgi:D-beta-D-heptose 7-phosphate kinase/D-beta-D-heptose 1-phosphate adenosyltransferase
MIIEKISEWELLRAEADSKVIFTNGCFDILHSGHIDLFDFCKRLGDCLVVGLNTDRSITEIKGSGRPIMNETDRARIVNALRSVDYVILFDEPTPQRLIEAIRPDVLVKGKDWQGKEVAGAEFVKSYGGQVVFAPLTEGKSTSAIIEKISNRVHE